MSIKTKFYLFRTLQIIATLVTTVIIFLFWFNVLSTGGKNDYLFTVLFIAIIGVVVFGEITKKVYVRYMAYYAPVGKKKFFLLRVFFEPLVAENMFEKVVLIIIVICEVLLWGDIVLFALHINDTAGVIETIVFCSLIVGFNIILRIARLVRRNQY